MLHLAACAALALALSACGANRRVESVDLPYDYQQRHPLVIADRAELLSIAVTGRSHLDGRQAADIRAFAGNYRLHGKSEVHVFVPAGTGQEPAVHATLRATQRELAAAGIPASAIATTRYSPGDGDAVPTLRLSFMKLGVTVASTCGRWPSDLASGSSTDGWTNAAYWNFGCAYQANFAAQIAEPLDLARPRQESVLDTQKRLRGIGQLRQGKDPSTVYRSTQRVEDLGQ
ncbi:MULTISPECIES: CpaD family pilus assembly protein [unclassified Chelatococcus]|uniref:CpaD family pilus assembly protein n=1 Tax=unclassified Chelatococcus TaxID=2638111 RepID=UPI001BCDC581|nr:MULTISPECIES: CpaD family pilus assembly protein [unclassified Chelatococcus]CAH1662088.1 Flp pilus assembly protein CpaD [Hyphomicrobiales bacterium]MBS7741343.1 CpaD family pilus assembly protein [Chelatococcus sp. HY11]MBX3546175.1 CpaD family pilus assembly protein [Chelatococcus sp.]MCO5077176.1 CpaD family pilus assembly protein [Chelatococcus sp.]CAH1682844.1 Flp pilus assembly protein CpaD [Hyphomicrobiales bacterium]